MGPLFNPYYTSYGPDIDVRGAGRLRRQIHLQIDFDFPSYWAAQYQVHASRRDIPRVPLLLDAGGARGNSNHSCK
jgi:hypothetical protein